ncbi:hypothetical protein [Caudoviricetes sp.]|nr:hypothetical protein [Caudoviricetes sp.]
MIGLRLGLGLASAVFRAAAIIAGGDFLTTRGGDPILTRSGDNIIWR